MTMPDTSLAPDAVSSILDWPGWPVMLGPFVGSFAGVLVTRAEAPGSIVTGRSACPHCGARLGARDLVPLFSWASTGGRCRHCRHELGLFYPGIELAATLVALWAVFQAHGATALWIASGLAWILLALAATDFEHYLLPDFLTLPLAAAGLAVAWLLDRDAFPAHVIGAAAGLSFIIALHYVYRWSRGRDGIGLGDAKLFAAAGAWTGWAGLPSVMLIAALTGLAFAVIRRRDGRISGADRVPLGAFLSLGLWLVWLYGPVGNWIDI
jgi:leader peptidase (prepilin peptidase)/N-methyltransferase